MRATPGCLQQRCAAITQANSSSNSDRLPAWLLGSFLFLFAGQVHAEDLLVALDDSFGIPFGKPLQVEEFGVLENHILDDQSAGENGATAELLSGVANGTLNVLN
ncbi:MAG: hypothetical protein U9N50_05730 [Pseudomonadota bacterium]|nr:hypothetical protein [Pseudomonadota bacterium]